MLRTQSVSKCFTLACLLSLAFVLASGCATRSQLKEVKATSEAAKMAADEAKMAADQAKMAADQAKMAADEAKAAVVALGSKVDGLNMKVDEAVKKAEAAAERAEVAAESGKSFLSSDTFPKFLKFLGAGRSARLLSFCLQKDI